MKRASTKLSKLKKEELQKMLKQKDAALLRFKEKMKIESALEMVRVRSLAMRITNELQGVVNIVFEELGKLGIGLDSATINVWKAGSRDVEVWAASASHSNQGSFHVPYFDHPIIKDIWRAYESGQESLAKTYSKQAKDTYVTYFLKNTDFKNLSEERKRIILEGKGYSLLYAFSKNVSISIYNYDGKSFPGSVRKVLIKFARVFEQTYIRFLDLQKAEAQAREAQIEVSLERVRAQAMGMHHSDELSDVLSVLFDQFDVLGIRPVYTFLSLIDLDKNKFTYRQTGRDGQRVIAKQVIDLNSMVEWKDTIEQMKLGKIESINCHHYPKEALPKIWNVFHEIYAALPKGSKVYPEDFPDGMYTTQAHCKFGYIGFDHTRAAIEEEKDILQRFAKEFARLYQRFLDLQKAEAQAREAQIEVSLERVRSKAMAMHKSDDLNMAVAAVFEELEKLDFGMSRCGIGILNKEKRSANVWTTSKSEQGTAVHVSGDESMDIHPLLQGAFEAWLKQEDHSYILEGEDLANYYNALGGTNFRLPESQSMVEKAEKLLQHYYVATFQAGGLYSFREARFPEEAKLVMRRFASVFNLTYKRFLDIQKAEAQARESQIEVSLERVRSRAMAMQNSEELNALIGTVFNELTKLDFVLTRCVIMIYDPITYDVRWWMANSEAPSQPMNYLVKHHELPCPVAYLKGWNERSLKWQYELKGTIKKEWDDFLFVETELSLLPDFVIAGMKAPDGVWLSSSFNNFGCLTLASLEPLSDDHLEIMIRFAKVFDLTYTRFNDLKQAEAQAREARIENALEKVRSRSLAMHKSDELQEVINAVFDKLKELEIETDTATILISKEGSKDIEGWIQNAERTYSSSILMPYLEKSIISRDLVDGRENAKDVLSKGYTIEEKNEFFNYLFAHSDLKHIPGERKLFVLNAKSYTTSQANTKYAGIALARYADKQFSDKENEILKRFARVFEQAYIRFLDLQKAEAQTREAQIEAALEKVRSRSLAMHKSDELQEVVNTVFERFTGLDVGMDSASIAIFREGVKSFDYWIASPVQRQSISFHIPYFDSSITKDMWIARESGKDFLGKSYSYEEKNEWFNHAFEHSGFKFLPDDRKRFILDSPAISVSIALSKNTGVQVNRYSEKLLSEKEIEILKRFGKVFEQAYIRFLDLQKAEAQAREATIEASLERVRAKAMAMHSTTDLTATVSTIFVELRILGIKPLRFGLGIMKRESRNAALYSASVSDDGGNLQLVGWVLLENHPVLEEIYDGWLKKVDAFFPVLKGDLLKSYYEKLRPGFQTPDWHADYEQYGQFYYFEDGALYAWSEKPIEPAEIPIYKRFTSVLALTYKRYNELQLSETNTREAVRRASIDRVRAEIASMRTTKDLERITPLIWNELTELGVPFIRCGVFIMDESQEIIHTFLSTPDGNAIAAFHLPYSTPGNMQLALSNWKKKERYIDHWTEDVFREFADTLIKQGALTSPDQYLSSLPRGGFYLHFLPFLQGMLYVGNTEQLKDDQLQLIQSVADAFSTAYARYEDFNKLEAAKQQVDKTLVDLKQTQNQLVQAEKMASLGELTAGIAHEIQNPLNFVNNFSEVSNELIDEMVEEVQKGNFAEANAIANDVKKNLEKINHHGKRADGIVKSMLQHSRSSSGQKELTDINELCDEYLRLSYHGLRAKDKSFNAKFETDFDPSLEKVDIVPQDIGRVILNLINNAFYAVTEKRKDKLADYEPTISVSTKKSADTVFISVKDNGNGIPQKVLDKIFQPFFTTKPTGQGTGLGLSLSYDILKAHGGGLKVETIEGEGSEFIITLPV